MDSRSEISHSRESSAQGIGTPGWVWRVLLGVAVIAIFANGYLVVVAIDSQPECVAASSSANASSYKPARQSCR